MPLPPYIASRRGVDEQRPRRLSDHVRPRGRIGGGTDRGPAFHRTAGRGFAGARHRPSSRDAACRSRHLPAGQGRRHGGSHRMHAEWGSVSAETAAALNATRRAGGRIVAVGSTSLRLIESAAAEDGTLAPFSGETALFITPGYRFRAVDAMLTNFHLPRSTLFMLVSAFCGLDVDAPRLCACDRKPAIGSTPTAMPVCCSDEPETMRDHSPSASSPPTAPRAPAKSSTAHGMVRTPAFMPVGTQAAVKGVHHDDVRAAGRRHPARQHLSPDAAARRRTRRGARRPAHLHALAAADPHRFRRLSGDVAFARCAK